MLVTSLAASVAFATQDALPDSPLHDVKIATEQVRLALARSPEHLVAVELDVAAARLQEAAALEAQDRGAEADAAVSAYGEHLAKAAARLEESQPAPDSAQVEQFRAQVAKQLQQSAPAPDPKASAGSPVLTALAIASEVANVIRSDDRVGAPDIAVAAANAAAKAAANVERRVPAAVSEIPASASTSTPPATTTASTAATPRLTESRSVASSGSVRATSTSNPAAASTSQATSTPSRPKQAEPTKAPSDNHKIDSNAKAAREAADRAQQAAERAKQAEKTKNGKDSRSND